MGFRGKSKGRLIEKPLEEILCQNVPGFYLLAVFLLLVSSPPAASPVLVVPGEARQTAANIRNPLYLLGD